MIRKSTLVVLLAAIALGAAVYYFDWRRSQKENEKPSADADKLAYSIQPQDVNSLTIAHPGNSAEPVQHFEKRDGIWQVTQPIETRADQFSLEGIVNSLSSARIAQTEPGTPDRLKVFGLAPPAVSIEFQIQNGAKHTLALGNKDFTGISVYAVIDAAKDVVLLPESLLVSTNKSLQDLRDKNVLHIVNGEVVSFDLKNPSGQVSATKEKDEWNFKKHAEFRGDQGNVDALLSALSSAKMNGIASETPDNLAKYGLANPAVTFSAVDGKGKSSTLIVGKKEDGQYFARDTSRPTIFRIDEDLYRKLAQNSGDLRDKKLAHFDPAVINHVEIHNSSGTFVCTRKSERDWTIDEPADQKGKSPEISKVFLPLEQAVAEQVFDQPSPDLRAKLAKPAFEATLTDKSGKKLTVQISGESGGFVYAKTSDSPAIYKFNKQILTDLSFSNMYPTS
ncbi:MAG TPA: DUF4340 domain-containing protein [Candidatus Acidoferrales bacterium]